MFMHHVFTKESRLGEFMHVYTFGVVVIKLWQTVWVVYFDLGTHLSSLKPYSFHSVRQPRIQVWSY